VVRHHLWVSQVLNKPSKPDNVHNNKPLFMALKVLSSVLVALI